MSFQRSEEGGDAFDQGIVDDALVLERFDLVPALLAFRMNLVLLRTDERSLVHIGVDFDVGIIAELQRVLEERC
jgi:hypothetical protein